MNKLKSKLSFNNQHHMYFNLKLYLNEYFNNIEIINNLVGLCIYIHHNQVAYTIHMFESNNLTSSPNTIPNALLG